MASTYTSILATPKDRARLLLGDTGVDGNVFLLTDEEINAMLLGSRFNSAVADLAESLAARFAQYPDETDTPGGHKLKWSERVAAWKDLGKRLRSDANKGTRRNAAYLGNLTNPHESKIR